MKINSFEKLIEWYNFDYYIIKSFEYDNSEDFKKFQRAYEYVKRDLFTDLKYIELNWRSIHSSIKDLKNTIYFSGFILKILKDLNPYISSVFQKRLNRRKTVIAEDIKRKTEKIFLNKSKFKLILKSSKKHSYLKYLNGFCFKDFNLNPEDFFTDAVLIDIDNKKIYFLIEEIEGFSEHIAEIFNINKENILYEF